QPRREQRRRSALPLDVAADARLLIGTGSLAREQRIDRRSEVGAGDGDLVARTRSVELSPVRELALRVEDEKVRGARRVEGARDVLRLVVEIGERVAVSLGLGRHRPGAVLRV